MSRSYYRFRNPAYRSDTLRSLNGKRPGRSLGGILVGRDFARKGDLDKAQRAFERALLLYPSHVDAQCDLARLFAQRGEWEKALAAFRRLLELTPGFGYGYIELGQVLVELGRSVEARRAFETALRWNPEDAFVMTNLAFSFRAEGGVDMARRAGPIRLVHCSPDRSTSLTNVTSCGNV